MDDVSLYPKGWMLVTRDEVVGFVRGYVPFLGWLVISFQDVYWVKYAFIVTFIACIG